MEKTRAEILLLLRRYTMSRQILFILSAPLFLSLPFLPGWGGGSGGGTFHISSSCCRPTFRQREAKHTHTHTVHTTTKHPPQCNTGRGWMGRNAVNNAIAHLVICRTRRTFAGMWHPTRALSQRGRLLHHGRPVSAQSQDC